MKKVNEWENEIMNSFLDKKVARQAWESLKNVAKATCLVKRVEGKVIRRQFHESHLGDFSLPVPLRKAHRDKIFKWEEAASGTGVLWSPPYVITNNHVIMDIDEAVGAEVYFNYTKDCQRKNGAIEGDKVYKFGVKSILTSSMRTASPKDHKSLDFTMLELDVKNELDKKILAEHALDPPLGGGHWLLPGDKGVKMIMIGHPHGLAKRLSIGPVPEHVSSGFSHVTHTLPSCAGNSGSNLFFFDSKVTIHNFTKWMSAYVHYRNGYAVDSGAIFRSFVESQDVAFRKYERLTEMLEEFIEELASPGGPDDVILKKMRKWAAMSVGHLGAALTKAELMIDRQKKRDDQKLTQKLGIPSQDK